MGSHHMAWLSQSKVNRVNKIPNSQKSLLFKLGVVKSILRLQSTMFQRS